MINNHSQIPRNSEEEETLPNLLYELFKNKRKHWQHSSSNYEFPNQLINYIQKVAFISYSDKLDILWHFLFKAEKNGTTY